MALRLIKPKPTAIALGATYQPCPRERRWRFVEPATGIWPWQRLASTTLAYSILAGGHQHTWVTVDTTDVITKDYLCTLSPAPYYMSTGLDAVVDAHYDNVLCCPNARQQHLQRSLLHAGPAGQLNAIGTCMFMLHASCLVIPCQVHTAVGQPAKPNHIDVLHQAALLLAAP